MCGPPGAENPEVPGCDLAGEYIRAIFCWARCRVCRVEKKLMKGFSSTSQFLRELAILIAAVSISLFSSRTRQTRHQHIYIAHILVYPASIATLVWFTRGSSRGPSSRRNHDALTPYAHLQPHGDRRASLARKIYSRNIVPVRTG